MPLRFYLKVRIQSTCHLKLLHEKVDKKKKIAGSHGNFCTYLHLVFCAGPLMHILISSGKKRRNCKDTKHVVTLLLNVLRRDGSLGGSGLLGRFPVSDFPP